MKIADLYTLSVRELYTMLNAWRNLEHKPNPKEPCNGVTTEEWLESLQSAYYHAVDNQYGKLAAPKKLELLVMKSAAGFYLGTFYGGPYSRESEEYWKTQEEAEQALKTGNWIQRAHP